MQNDLEPVQLQFCLSLRQLLTKTGVFGRVSWVREEGQEYICAYPMWLFEDMLKDMHVDEINNFVYVLRVPEETNIKDITAFQQKLVEYNARFLTMYIRGNRKEIILEKEPNALDEKKKHNYDGIGFDSEEEIQFYKWLQNCIEAGLVSSFEYQPESFSLSEKYYYEKKIELKTKTKYEDRVLLQPHVYTADYKIIAYRHILDLFPEAFIADIHKDKDLIEIYVDVKGEFNQNDAWRRFSIDQKWVYQAHGIYVYKVIPKKFFLATFVPDEVAFTKRGNKRRKPFEKCKLFSEIQEKLL